MTDVPPTALRVLVIDDDPEGARTLSELFRCYGCATAVAYSGRVGLRLSKLFRPELVFVDFDMPDMNGLEVVAEAKVIDAEDGRHATYVCLTAGGPEITQEKADAAGFSRLLYKPLKVTDLLAVLLTARPGNFTAGTDVPAIRPARNTEVDRPPRH
ncbi:Response regulator receiver domain-containing protein [Roseateles sp. YR242]|uniref:response regulator n=1 Tax=Roseateles sp. YR242 TaxID=1855305 RepID=UPI0008C6A783|nr:response regulator [Roseateles sp. YR242]SEK26742.1 Response regulator receiver domain-containing protein [Roseateles sp. YR242]